MAEASAWLRRLHPPVVTATLVAAVIATGVRFHVFRHELPLVVQYRSGFSGRALLAGRFHTVVSSQLLTRDGFMLVSIVASLVIMLGGYEVLAGSRRAAIVAVLTAVAAPVTVELLLAIGSGRHVEFAARTLSTVDFGASAITAGGGGALVGVLGRRWLRRGAVAFVLSGLVVHHQLADWQHLVAFPLGYAIAVFPAWPVLRRHLHSSMSTNGSPAPATWWRLVGSVCVVTGVVVGSAVASGSVGATTATASVPTTIGVAASAAAVAPGPATSVHAVGSRATVSPLRVADVRFPTPSLGGDRRVLVVLPAGYGSTTVRYPVIEVLHGRPGRPDDVLSGLDLLGVMDNSQPFIAVVPDGRGPQVADGDFADTSRQRLGAALSDDLRHWVDNTYRTTGLWGITGFSAGGYGAAYLANRPAGGYARSCPMSGYFTAHDPPFQGESQAVRDAASPLLHTTASGPPTMLIVGDADSEGLAEAHAYIAALTHSGQRNSLVVVHGGHATKVWHAALPRCIGFLLDETPVGPSRHDS